MNQAPEALKQSVNPLVQNMPTKISLLLIVVAILSTGCIGGMRQAYPGPALPNEKIAILKMPQCRKCSSSEVTVQGYAIQDLILYRIDGKKAFGPETATLLPGQHTLLFLPRAGVNPFSLFGTRVKPSESLITNNLEAGKSYVAIPHYVQIDNDGKSISGDTSSIRDVAILCNVYYTWWVTIAEEK